MEMMARKGVVFTTAAVALLVLMHTGPVTMNSDPAGDFCASVCWEENALAEQCERTKGCDISSQPYPDYTRCSEPCQQDVAACQMLCRTNFHTVLDECTPLCEGDPDSYEHCTRNCFTHRALRLKFRQRQHDSNRPSRWNQLRQRLHRFGGRHAFSSEGPHVPVDEPPTPML